MGFLRSIFAAPLPAVVLLSFSLFLTALPADEPAGTETPSAQEADAELIKNLTEACNRAATSFSAELAVQSVDNLKTHARLETKNLLYLLNRSTEKEKAAEQIEFLRLEDLRKTLSEEKTDMSIVLSTLAKFEEDKEGLELPDFMRLRNILSDYVEAVDRSKEGNLQEDFKMTCDALPRDVQDYLDDPASAEAPGRIAASLDFLDECQRNSSNVRDITNLLRGRFTQPNVQASLGERVLYSDQPIYVSEPTKTTEIIRGTPVYSSGTMEATIKPMLQANEETAIILLVFTSEIRTNNLAISNKGINVLSESYGKVMIYKQILFDGKEIKLGNTDKDSGLESTIKNIDTSRRPLVAQFAQDAVLKEFPASKAEAKRLMEARVLREFDERLKAVTEPNERLEKVWNLLRKYDYMPEVKTRTTAKMLELNARIGGPRQVTAERVPDVQLGPHDMVARFHQSAINNPLHELFSKRRLSEKEVKAWIRENIPEVDIDRLAEEAAEKLRSATDEVSDEESCLNGDSFYISFCEELPAYITLDDDVLGVHVRIDAFEQKEKKFPGLDIDVEYKLEKKDGRWIFTLQDCEAWPPEVSRGAVVPARYQVIRRQVKNRLQAALPESIPLKAVPLFTPATNTTGNTAASTEATKPKLRGHVSPGELTLTDGWLIMGADFTPLK